MPNSLTYQETAILAAYELTYKGNGNIGFEVLRRGNDLILKPWRFVSTLRPIDVPKKIYFREITVSDGSVFCRDGDIKVNLLTKIKELEAQEFIKIEFPQIVFDGI